MRLVPRNTDDQYDALKASEPLWDFHLADPKPARRVKADQNEWQRLRAEKMGPCRLCGTISGAFVDGVTLHHVVPKGGGRGDDVAENLVPLCGHGTVGCHGKVEARDPWARSLLGQRLTDAERAYVVGKQGAAWLERHYGVKEAA
jgi:hypothetical protein